MKPCYILFPVLIIFFSCSKHYEDYSYWNTDRRPQVILVSERYTSPPALNNDLTWRPYKIVFDSLDRDIDPVSYMNVKADTFYSTCSIDKIDSQFKIEIRKFKIFKR